MNNQNQNLSEKEFISNFLNEHNKVDKKGELAYYLAVIPLFVIVYCSVYTIFGDSEAWVIAFVYYCTVGIPIFIISIILGLISLKTNGREKAIASFKIHLLKVIIIIVMIIYSSLFG